VHLDIQIPRRAAIASGLALAREAHAIPGVHAAP
jgi:hypothetical protein